MAADVPVLLGGPLGRAARDVPGRSACSTPRATRCRCAAWPGTAGSTRVRGPRGPGALIADLGRRTADAPGERPGRARLDARPRDRRDRPGRRRLRHAACPGSTPPATAAAPASSAPPTRASASPPCTRRPRARARGWAPRRLRAGARSGRRRTPTSRRGGHHAAARRPWSARAASRPHWATQVLQNTLAPYFVLYVKHGRPAADRAQHRRVPARPHRAQALRARRPRAAPGARDQEHGHQRRDEAALVALPHREPRHPLPRGLSRAATTPSGWRGCGSRRRTAG